MNKTIMVIFLIALLKLNADQTSCEITLTDLIRTAMQNNRDIRQAVFDMEKAAAVIDEARSAIIPDISLNTRNVRMDMYMGAGAQTGDSWTLSLVQPLYTGGKTGYALRIARTGDEMAQFSVKKSVYKAVYDTINACFQLLKADEGVRVLEESMLRVKEHKRIANAHLSAGTAVKSDVLRVEVKEAGIQFSLVNAVSGLKKAEEYLDFVLGVNLPDGSVIEKPGDIERVDFDKEGLLEEALAKRPDAVLLQKQLKLSGLDVKLAEGDRKPMIATFMSRTLGKRITAVPESWQMGISCDLLLADGGYVRGKIREKRADEDKMQEAYLKFQDSVRLEINSLKNDLDAAWSGISVAEKGLQLAEENLRLAEAQFKAGVITSVTLMDDELELISARNRMITARYDYRLAVASLYHALGRIGDYEMISEIFPDLK